MKIGLFGGTFDPIHNGHIKLCDNLIELRNLDKVILVPAAIPPHKLNKTISPFLHRYNMCKLSIKDRAKFCVSDIEEKRLPLHSYTYDTLCEVSKSFPLDEIFFIIGADSLLQLHTWYKARELVTKFNLITYVRDDSVVKEDELLKYWDAGSLSKLINSLVSWQTYDVSSSKIRDMIKNQNESYLNLVPLSVADYIQENKLYIHV